MQINKLIGLVFIVGIVSSIGCAKLEFYDNEKLTGTPTGIKFYQPKPYLLVVRTDKSDKPIEVSITYLPDYSKPTYVKLESGWGNAELSLSMENGILKSVGQKTDTKIPETITALSAIPSAVLPKTLPKPPKATLFELYEIDNSTGSTILKKVEVPK